VLISKEDMIEVYFIARTEEIQAKKKNILSRYEVSEIWALNFTTLQARLKLFLDGGVNLTKFRVAPWIKP
jgi:hypothetical protein